MRPVSEVLLDDEAVRRFRSRYREQFGATGTDDPLYESVSAGRRYVGMEHWLPLYYEQLETLFDYLPGAGVSLDYQAEEVRGHRLEAIADFYAARHNVTPAARAGAPVYRPIRPDQLYLDSREWQAALRGAAGRPARRPSPPIESDGDAFDAGARPARNFAAERADPNVVLFEAVRDYLEAERKSGRKTAVAAFSAGLRRPPADRAARARRLRPAAGRRRPRRCRPCRARRSGSPYCRSSRALRPTTWSCSASRTSSATGSPAPRGAGAASTSSSPRRRR